MYFDEKNFQVLGTWVVSTMRFWISKHCNFAGQFWTEFVEWFVSKREANIKKCFHRPLRSCSENFQCQSHAPNFLTMVSNNFCSFQFGTWIKATSTKERNWYRFQKFFVAACIQAEGTIFRFNNKYSQSIFIITMSCLWKRKIEVEKGEENMFEATFECAKVSITG